jgi:hypothetical protein
MFAGTGLVADTPALWKSGAQARITGLVGDEPLGELFTKPLAKRYSCSNRSRSGRD